MDAVTESDATPSSATETLVESLLFDLLQLPATQRPARLTTLCERHPEHAATLRRRLVLLANELPAAAAPAADARIGRFELLRRLGGGMSDAWLALDPERGAQVVVKVLRHAELLDGPTQRSFEREAMAASRLQHPGIGAVLEVGEDGGIPYLVRPYVAGITLAEWIDRRRVRGSDRGLGRADFDLLLGWLADIAQALDVAHGRGLVHRDVKPANILLPYRGRPQLLDFGLCQDLAPTGAAAAAVPVGGTLAYMAPELLSPRERPAGPGVDVYALGVTLYECATLRLPFAADDPQRLCRAILLQDVPDPRRWCRDLPRGLRRVLACAMAKAAWERYPSAAALADDLLRLRRNESVLPPRPAAAARLGRWCRRHHRVLLPAVLLAVPLLGLLFADRFVASPAAAELELLALPARIAAATADAALLVPGWPDQVPALEDWLARQGEPLAALLPALRARGDELARDPGPDPAAAATLRAALAQIESFATGPHGTLARVRERLAWARQVAAVTLVAPAAAWQATIAEVAADPRHGGLRLEPQLDLVPLGRDPDSGLFEFYHPRSGAPGMQPVYRDERSRRLVVHDSCGLVFVLIPPGRCLLGEQPFDPRAPRYDPTAGRLNWPFEFEFEAFFLAKHELTQAQWLRLTGTQPAAHRVGHRYWQDVPIGYRHPVESVSALQCDAVLAEVGLVLPTEAQWEYACGAGAATRWFFGSDAHLLPTYGNVDDRRFAAARPGVPAGVDGDDGFACVASVGRHLPNRFGLHDMAGNVAEWCRDGFANFTESLPLPGDGMRCWGTTPEAMRVFRGGSFCGGPYGSSSRLGARADARLDCIGLRPARVVHGGRR